MLLLLTREPKSFFLQRPENEALCKVIGPFLFCRGPRLCDLACTPFSPDCFQAGGSSAASSYLLLGPTFLLRVAREFPRHERERLESRGVGGGWTITERPGFRDDDDNCRIFSKVRSEPGDDVIGFIIDLARSGFTLCKWLDAGLSQFVMGKLKESLLVPQIDQS